MADTHDKGKRDGSTQEERRPSKCCGPLFKPLCTSASVGIPRLQFRGEPADNMAQQPIGGACSQPSPSRGRPPQKQALPAI